MYYNFQILRYPDKTAEFKLVAHKKESFLEKFITNVSVLTTYFLTKSSKYVLLFIILKYS
jgi:hypothetical protein